MGQAGRSDRALEVGLLARVTVAAILTGATVVRGTVVGEHLSVWAPAGLLLGSALGILGVACGVLELVGVGVCAVSLARPGRARLETVPRGRARLVPTGLGGAAAAW